MGLKTRIVISRSVLEMLLNYPDTITTEQANKYIPADRHGNRRLVYNYYKPKSDGLLHINDAGKSILNTYNAKVYPIDEHSDINIVCKYYETVKLKTGISINDIALDNKIAYSTTLNKVWYSDIGTKPYPIKQEIIKLINAEAEKQQKEITMNQDTITTTVKQPAKTDATGAKYEYNGNKYSHVSMEIIHTLTDVNGITIKITDEQLTKHFKEIKQVKPVTTEEFHIAFKMSKDDESLVIIGIVDETHKTRHIYRHKNKSFQGYASGLWGNASMNIADMDARFEVWKAADVDWIKP